MAMPSFYIYTPTLSYYLANLKLKSMHVDTTCCHKYARSDSLDLKLLEWHYFHHFILLLVAGLCDAWQNILLHKIVIIPSNHSHSALIILVTNPCDARKFIPVLKKIKLNKKEKKKKLELERISNFDGILIATTKVEEICFIISMRKSVSIFLSLRSEILYGSSV